MLTVLSFPLPSLFAYLVGIAEFFGGIGILLGVATRFSAYISYFFAWAGVKSFGLDMVTELPNGNSFAGGAVDWAVLGLTISLLIAGSGALSVSARMNKGGQTEDGEM